ncbi:unknown [Ruminococcus sp. CAG:382]|nr:unknown [Ruminococcus sp. CAG:382]
MIYTVNILGNIGKAGTDFFESFDVCRTRHVDIPPAAGGVAGTYYHLYIIRAAFFEDFRDGIACLSRTFKLCRKRGLY